MPEGDKAKLNYSKGLPNDLSSLGLGPIPGLGDLGLTGSGNFLEQLGINFPLQLNPGNATQQGNNRTNHISNIPSLGLPPLNPQSSIPGLPSGLNLPGLGSLHPGAQSNLNLGGAQGLLGLGNIPPLPNLGL